MSDNIWIIKEADDQSCGHRFVAFPATRDILAETLKIFEGEEIKICQEIKEAGGAE